MKWRCAAAVLALALCAQVYGDQKCVARGGKCQDVRTPCRGGHYFRNFCSGSSRRRCCVPVDDNGCLKVTQRLACRLLSSSNIIAAKRHPSGVSDNAFAYNNIRDVCRGKMAARSSYKCNKNCHAPGGTTCLSFNLLSYLMDLKKGGSVKINEIAGACHSCKSRHYSGLAVDLNPRGRLSDFMSKCRARGGFALNEGSHVHCQFYDGRHPNW